MKGKEEKKFGPKLDATTSTLPGALNQAPPRPGPGYNVPPEPPLVGSGSLHHQPNQQSQIVVESTIPLRRLFEFEYSQSAQELIFQDNVEDKLVGL